MSVLTQGETIQSEALSARGIRAVRLAQTDSTNSDVRRLAEAGDPGNVWVRAEQQSAGRGRFGHKWVSPSGNLMASLLLRPNCAPAVAAQLSYVAALSLVQVLSGHLQDHRLSLKWPNDVLVSGRKIAGILLESHSVSAERLEWLGIGIGVNLASHPQDVSRPATHLAAETSASAEVPGPDAVLVALGLAFDGWFDRWDLGRGFSLVRSAWLARAQGLGGPVTARLASESISGQFEGLDENGGLVLRQPDGARHVIHGGDVFIEEPPAKFEPGTA